ncbi:hypothetical protein PG984_012956 [Apiospora sp. TS-2023a]
MTDDLPSNFPRPVRLQSKGFAFQRRLIWHRVRPVAKFLGSTCPLCRTLGNLITTETRLSDGPWSLVCSSVRDILDQDHYLDLEPTLYPILHFIPSDKLNMGKSMAVHSRSYLAVDARGNSSDHCRDWLYPRPIDANAIIDIQHIRDLIGACSEKHGSCLNRQEMIQGLKVIDCITQDVIVAPRSCQYLALSYVWGVTQGERNTPFSKVVQDSIAVTIALGYRYIWVDRYCIDQDDTHKQHIFNQMHRIYSGAFVTIIAAAGSDAEHGLPGVSVGRPDQVNLQLGNLRLTQIIPYRDNDITSSVWYTRAWTYQESYFSKRRLIFTEQQVLYLCNESRQSEGFPSEMVHITPDHKGPSPVPQLRRPSKFDPFSVRNDIRMYTQRQLTYPSDSLNAILGVIQYYMELNLDDVLIRHVWGVPLYKELKSQKFMLDLGWAHKKPGQRRSGFPSWTWAGWSGELDWLMWLVGPELDWSFSDECQRDITLDSLLELTYQGCDQPRNLVITTKICPVLIRRIFAVDRQSTSTTEATSKVFVLFPFWDGYIGVPCLWDEEPSPDGEYYAADLGKQFGNPLDSTLDRQLILQKKDQRFVRIGISKIYRCSTLSFRNTEARHAWYLEPWYLDRCFESEIRLIFNADGVLLGAQRGSEQTDDESPWAGNLDINQSQCSLCRAVPSASTNLKRLAPILIPTSVACHARCPQQKAPSEKQAEGKSAMPVAVAATEVFSQEHSGAAADDEGAAVDGVGRRDLFRPPFKSTIFRPYLFFAT